MSHYIGIDLGTTNSVVCSYDGRETRVWKSPEQNDVTPSAIYIDGRGHKHVGKRAYDYAPHEPKNVARLFKRLMGTATQIDLPGTGSSLTPQECSAEVLRCLYGYLQQGISDNVATGTVITVPAAFNQMQKNATLEAAEIANIGKVALMQEPVAAVLRVMRSHPSDGMFVVYDLGGGTLDVAIAQSDGGHVNLLAQGGIAMCGGRDFDRRLVDSVIKPWLLETFDLPTDFSVHSDYSALLRLCGWAAERTKIELSVRDEAWIRLLEGEAGVSDRSGEKIYLDVPVDRNRLNELIDDRMQASINEVRKTLSQSGLDTNDIERIVFVGGPTNYSPLREMVSFELGIASSTEVNPMTAVAEGAALFAESIDWDSEEYRHKSSRGTIMTREKLNLKFAYTARTPDDYAKIVAKLEGGTVVGAELQVDCLDTGWTSGKLPLTNGATVDVFLATNGENRFKVMVVDARGRQIDLDNDGITITKTAIIDSIPASHAVGIEVADRVGGERTLDWILSPGDILPSRCTRVFKAEHSLVSGTDESLNFKLYEGDGESDEPSDNRFIGQLKISGNDFEGGEIKSGAKLECDFHVQESGAIMIEVSIPSIRGTFGKGQNFYSWQKEGFDFNDPDAAATIVDESNQVLDRLGELIEIADEPRLAQIQGYLKTVADITPEEADPERLQEIMETVLEARRDIGKVKKDHFREIRQRELDKVVGMIDKFVRPAASAIEEKALDSLLTTIERSISRNDRDFDEYMGKLWGACVEVLWREDWFVAVRFKSLADSPERFRDTDKYHSLVSDGREYIEAGDTQALRRVVFQLMEISVDEGRGSEMDMANILRA